MKEIKFRAWNTQENKMLYRKLFEMNWYETDKNDASGCHTWGAISGGQSRFLEVMQFTGKKDCRGLDIYEGDIIEDDKFWYEIKWDNDSAQFIMRDIYNDEDMGMSELTKYSSVEGNIYQNKDLIK